MTCLSASTERCRQRPRRNYTCLILRCHKHGREPKAISERALEAVTFPRRRTRHLLYQRYTEMWPFFLLSGILGGKFKSLASFKHWIRSVLGRWDEDVLWAPKAFLVPRGRGWNAQLAATSWRFRTKGNLLDASWGRKSGANDEADGRLQSLSKKKLEMCLERKFCLHVFNSVWLDPTTRRWNKLRRRT